MTTPTKGADTVDQRTKNREQEHPILVRVGARPYVLALAGPGSLFVCECHEDPWIGWLPDDMNGEN